MCIRDRDQVYLEPAEHEDHMGMDEEEEDDDDGGTTIPPMSPLSDPGDLPKVQVQ